MTCGMNSFKGIPRYVSQFARCSLFTHAANFLSLIFFITEFASIHWKPSGLISEYA